MTREARARANCKEYAAITAQINELKKRQEELKAWLKVETEEKNTDFGTWLVTFIARSTPTVDVKRLQAERPEIFAEYGKVSDTRILKVKAK